MQPWVKRNPSRALEETIVMGGDSELRIRAMVQLPKGETCKVKFLGGFLSCKTMGCATNVSKHQKIGVTR